MKTEGVYTTINSTTHNPFIEIMIDLFDSNRLDEMRKVALLHGVYHVYGEVIEELIAQERYDEAQELLLDLVAGPFYERFVMHGMMQLKEEYTLIPRILFLLKLQDKTNLTPHARHLIDFVSPSVSFQKFAQRAQQQSSSTQQKDLTSYAQALSNHLEHESAQCACKHTHEVTNPLHSRDLRWYELFEKLAGHAQVKEMRSNTMTALQNIISYAEGGKNKLYARTLLKLDAQEIHAHVDPVEARDVLVKAGVYDFHIALSIRSFEEGKCEDAYALMYEMCQDSVVLRSSLEYYKMLTRGLVVAYINLMTPLVSYESAYKMRVLLIPILTQPELEVFDYVMQTHRYENPGLIQELKTISNYLTHHSSLLYHLYDIH